MERAKIAFCLIATPLFIAGCASIVGKLYNCMKKSNIHGTKDDLNLPTKIANSSKYLEASSQTSYSTTHINLTSKARKLEKEIAYYQDLGDERKELLLETLAITNKLPSKIINYDDRKMLERIRLNLL